jgi:hypothetical protein
MPASSATLESGTARIRPGKSRSDQAVDKSEFRHIFSTERENETAVGSSHDIASLRKRLIAQEAAREVAQEAAADVQRQLQLSETENMRMRDQLKQAADALEATKEEHSSAIQKAAERESGLSIELARSRDEAARARTRVVGYRRTLLGILIILVMPVMLWAAINYRQMPVAHAAVAPAPSAALPDPTTQDVTESVDRLDHALSKYRDQSAEQVLHQIHDANMARGISVCSFEWNNGQVSLLFGTKPGMGIGVAIAACANAVEAAAR